MFNFNIEALQTEEAKAHKAHKAHKAERRALSDMPKDWALPESHRLWQCPAVKAYFSGDGATVKGLNNLASTMAALHPRVVMFSSFKELLYMLVTPDPQHPKRMMAPSGWTNILAWWLAGKGIHEKATGGRKDWAYMAKLDGVALIAASNGYLVPTTFYQALPEEWDIACLLIDPATLEGFLGTLQECLEILAPEPTKATKAPEPTKATKASKAPEPTKATKASKAPEPTKASK